MILSYNCPGETKSIKVLKFLHILTSVAGWIHFTVSPTLGKISKIVRMSLYVKLSLCLSV